MMPSESIRPSKEAFASDPLGYGASAWLKWAMVRNLAGFPIDLARGPSGNDLKDPVLWLTHAHAMSDAAKTLMQADPMFRAMPENVRGICHCQYHAVALMLVGYSLEVCLKAMIIITLGEDVYQTREKEHHHHRLENLSDFIPALSDKDKAILKGLSHYVRWAGRYPDPGFGKESQAEEIFSLAENHRIITNDIFVLAAQIMSHVNHVLDSNSRK